MGSFTLDERDEIESIVYAALDRREKDRQDTCAHTEGVMRSDLSVDCKSCGKLLLPPPGC